MCACVRKSRVVQQIPRKGDLESHVKFKGAKQFLTRKDLVMIAFYHAI